MIIKFCFNNEIHRCTQPPMDHDALIPFLKSMFRGDLPASFSLFSLTSDGQRVPLVSQEDYQRILNSKGAETIKLYIEAIEEISFDDTEIIQKRAESACRTESEGYEVMIEPVSSSSAKTKSKQIIDDMEFDGIVEDQQREEIENSLMSIIESRLYGSISQDHEILDDQQTLLKRLVQETMKEKMPQIISELKGENTDEGLYKASPFEEELIQIEFVKPSRKSNSKSKSKKSVADTLRELGKLIKEALSDISQGIEGDPNEFYAARRMPRSVAQKATKIKEIFPEGRPEDIADFVLGLPRDFTTNELAELYAAKLYAGVF